MNKKNWHMIFDKETDNPIWFYTHYNDYYDEWRDGYENKYYAVLAKDLKSFKTTIKFDSFDKTFAWFKDINIKNRFYIVYLTDLKDFIHLLNNGEITGIFKYVNKNGNKGIRYIK
jgi:hypothetical protein